MMKIKSFIGLQTFLMIAIAISFYFGWHGYNFLKKPDGWNWPWQLALSTIVLVEIVFLNVFRADSYSKTNKIAVFVFGFLALAFSVALPLLSSWADYQKLDRFVDSQIEITEPEYYSENVIPALEEELKDAENLIAPRKAEKSRLMKIGTGEFRYKKNDGTIGITTGIDAARWIPWKSEKADFQKVDNLKKLIREYREADKTAKNSYEEAKNSTNASLKTAKSDKKYGWWSFWFKVSLIVFLGFASLYYMYSYSNPEKSEFNEKPLKRPTPKKPLVLSKDKKIVIEKFPDAEGTIVNAELVEIRSGGKVIGSAKLAPHAWRNARINIETKN